MIIHGDCVEVMAGMDPESVDAIVCDPPYGLEFMGKEWDNLGIKRGRHVGKDREMFKESTGYPASRAPSWSGQQLNEKCDACGRYKFGPTPEAAAARGRTHHKCMCEFPKFRARNLAPQMQAWHQQWAEAAYRVAKPSAYLLAFGGTRTVHRMTVALEDAGWIIRDMLVWGYASGFPKSKASLKPAWEPIVMARKPGPLRMLAIDECRIGFASEDDEAINAAKVSKNPTGKTGLYGVPGVATHNPAGRWPANIVLTDPIFDGGIEGVVAGDTHARGNVTPTKRENSDTAVYGYGVGLGPDGPIDPGDSGTYSRFFMLPTSRSTTPSGTMGTCQTCGAPVAVQPSIARTPPPDTAPLSADTSPGEPPAPRASDAVGLFDSPATATAPSPVATPSDGTPDSTGIAVEPSSIPSDTSGTGTSTLRGPRPGITSRSGQRARTAERPTTSTDTTTTTADPVTCERCADDATHGRTLPQPKLTRPALPPDGDNYTRFLMVPKAARSDREPVLGGLPIQHAGVGIRGAEAGEYEDFVYPAPEGIGAWLREHREAAGLSAKAVCAAIGAHGAVNHGGAMSNWEQELNRPTPEQWRGLRDLLRFDDRYDEVMTTTRTVPRQLMEGGPARRANNHPTVKPTELMRHLVRLVTPTGGVVLDPFLGSGTTALAAEMEGFEWIGIEREAEYVAIAEARLNGTQRGLGLESA